MPNKFVCKKKSNLLKCENVNNFILIYCRIFYFREDIEIKSKFNLSTSRTEF